MAEDKLVKKYFENLPYGNDSKSSEIHGKENQVVINKFITGLASKYDESMAAGDSGQASNYKSAIHSIARQLDTLKSIKEEFSVNYGGGVGGKNVFSNYTDLTWDKKFWTEQGRVNFDESMQPVLTIDGPNGEPLTKKITDITENWVVKGTEEQDFMKMQQDAVKQRNTINEPLNFDVDWAVSNLMSNMSAWKSFVSDKIGGKYFLNDYIQENTEAIKSGQIPDEMLHPDSFDPEYDNRLHDYYTSRLRKAFDPNHQTAKERAAGNSTSQANSQKKTFSPPSVGIQKRNNTNA
tara:strand:- start:1277 stop:2155 length:879 start_codon:yes stop_codon:yes gene_type:complete